jgi:hypothetical protein
MVFQMRSLDRRFCLQPPLGILDQVTLDQILDLLARMTGR